MLNVKQEPFANHLLAALPSDDWQALAPHLQLKRLSDGQLLSDSGESIQQVYFPTSAIISMVFLMADGATAEVATVGNEGMIGVSVLMGGSTMPSRLEVRSGGYAFAMNARLFKYEFEHRSFLHRLMLLYIQALLTQVAQSALCNRHHTITRQVCSWLLLTQDRMKSHQLTVTHQFIATMLGVRREGVSEAAHKLQEAGLIAQGRGHILVLDREGLEARSCECYGILKQEFERLLPGRIAPRCVSGHHLTATFPSLTRASLAEQARAVGCSD
jgi:CRP-like cAMP-binding protein